MADLITLDKRGVHWQVIINRPEKANALTREMLHQLRTIFVDAASDTALRTLVITGAGDRVFCGGADLSEVSGQDDPRDAIWDEMSQALVDVPALTIAMLNGHCIGGGLVLALCCDVRVCIPQSQFAYPALRMGALPGKIDGQRLQQLIGPARASLLLLGDARINADEALAWGLVERVAQRELLEETVDGICKTAQVSDRAHLVELKKRCWQSR